MPKNDSGKCKLLDDFLIDINIMNYKVIVEFLKL